MSSTLEDDVLPDELARPRTDGTVAQRLSALRLRYRLRQRRAEAYYADRMNPRRGLPIAGGRDVVTFVGGLLARHRNLVIMLILANLVSAAASLMIPRLLGQLVDHAAANLAQGQEVLDRVTEVGWLVAGLVAGQAAFTFLAKATAARLGQDVLAAAREHIMEAILRLPLSRVEQASSGDLVTRVTRDVGALSHSIRWALPEAIVAAISVVLTMVAMVANSWFLALPSIILLMVAGFQAGWYLRRAPKGYLAEGDTYSQINATLTETVEGARTTEALGLRGQRWARGGHDIEVSAQAERYTLTLRNLLFAVMDVCFSLPRVLVIILGAYGYTQGWVSIGQITTAALYVEAIWGPFDMLVSTMDEVQVGVTATSRLLGIADVPPDRVAGEEEPQDFHLVGRDLRYAYRHDDAGNPVDVLHGIDLDLRQGERLAIVGPSGSGKSTLGRLLAGIHGPRTGSVTVGGVDLVRLPLTQLRSEVALVTQEHHVFIGSVRDNVVLGREGASDMQVRQALQAVDAWEWVERLPGGLDTRIGSGNVVLTPAQAQQVALARLILADPHTIVLDEATSLIDPRTARHLEGSMNALLTGRTVVAIAHRLHTAHDADRIAVVIAGRIAELGSHDELVARNGEYARLWRAWTS